MKRVLLTGGTGFVGANLVRRLLRDGHAVHLLVRPSYASWRIADLADQVRLHAADLSDPEAVRRSVRRASPHWIFHLAAFGAYPEQADPDAMVTTNILGVTHLVRSALEVGFEAMVNAGSSSEYGFKDHAPSEEERLEPNSYYALTKAAATHFCRWNARQTGHPIPTLRLYSIYGPWEEPTRLIPTLIREGARGRLPDLADPRIARDFVHVDDAVEAFLQAAAGASDLEDPGAVFNIGSGTQTTLEEAVGVCRRVFDLSARPDWGSMPARRWDTSVWRADAEAVRRCLGWRARTPFESGFRRTAAWSEEHAGVLDAWFRERGGDGKAIS